MQELDSGEEFELLFNEAPSEESAQLSSDDKERVYSYLEKRREHHSQDLPGVSEGLSLQGVTPGTWLGFHDGDHPTMAKTALFDQENNLYLFVDREGRKIRELSPENLKDLLDRGLVDILQTRSN